MSNFLEEDEAVPMDFNIIRRILVDKGLVFLSVFLPLAITLSLFRISVTGWHNIYIVHLFCAFTIIIVTVIRRKLPYSLCAAIFIGIIFILGTAGVITYGLVGGGIIILALLTIMMALAFGTRAGLILCLVDICFIAVVGLAVDRGIITYSFDINEYATSFKSWVMMTALFFMFVPVIIVAMGMLHKHLSESLGTLREKQKEHERLVNNLSGAFLYRHDTAGVFQYVSPSVTEVLGYSVEEFLVSVDEYLTEHPVNSKVLEYTEKSIMGIKQPSYEVQIYGKDGSLHWLEVSETPVFDDSRNVTLVEGVAYDITERKLANEELFLSQERFEKTFRGTPDAIVVSHLSDGLMIDVNEAFEKLFSITRAEALGRTSIELDFWESADVRSKLFAPLSDNEPIKDVEMQFKRKQGDLFDANISADVIDFDGESCVISIIRDVSKHKELEDQLRQSEKMQAIGQLAGGVAHDFNNMLGGIIGAADLLGLQFSDNKEANKYVDMIITASERAAELNNKLLTFSRKGKHLSTSVNIHEIISETVMILERSIDKRIQLNIDLNAKDFEVLGDPAQLQNAILNLGVNARDAMPEGGELTISTESVELDQDYCNASTAKIEAGAYVRVSVCDSGVGIPLESIKRIFEPFYTTKEQGKGTGLGLAAVFGTVRDHNGDITVYSEPNEGTVFHLCFPLSEKSFIPKQKNNEEVSIPKGGGTVLVIDDEELIRATTSISLEHFGYGVMLAEDGEEGVRIYQETHDNIDLVILDMVMPKMNGTDAFYAIRKINPEAKIIIASGFTKDAKMSDLYKDGLIGFIKKPFNRRQLAKVLSEVLG